MTNRKVLLVTGAGIGAATALLAAARGYALAQRSGVGRAGMAGGR
ncbi:MAG: hypothetical protein Q8Q81_13525 [Oxalobacteraceae bacterium]|nr:hypothetical protein [Oxalobacteraceae bacterium]